MKTFKTRTFATGLTLLVLSQALLLGCTTSTQSREDSARDEARHQKVERSIMRAEGRVPNN